MSGLRSRLVLGGAFVIVAALLATFAIALGNAQSKATGDVKGRFRERAQVSASLTHALFATIAAESASQYAKTYGTARVSTAALAKQQAQSGSQGGSLAVLDASGRILAQSPRSPSNLAALVAANPRQLQAVLHGQPYALSDVYGAGSAMPTLEFLEPFPTTYGVRVLLSTFPPPLLAAFISGYLKQVPNTAGGHAYTLDSHGVVIASTDAKQASGRRVGEPGLTAAIAHRTEGSFGSRYFAAQPVAGSTWRVVLTAPRSGLFASVNGSRKWVPWGLFIAFAVVAAIAIVMLRGVLRSTAQVEVANRRLGEANDELAVTNRKLARRAAELARSNAELEQFASIASHDLQEPLRKVQTFAEQLHSSEREQLSDAGRDYLDRMSAAARRMQDLIDDLLRFSRVSTRKRDLEPVPLGEIVAEVTADLDQSIEATGATVDVGDLPAIDADRVQMRQLMQNLISNALKFHREDVAPVVRISAAVHDGIAEISVADNGIGIDEQYAERIFRVFERLHGRGAYPGTGIGLALCRKIAERHGGSVTVHSTPGEGATFVVALPLAQRGDPFETLQAEMEDRDASAGGSNGDRERERPYVGV